MMAGPNGRTRVHVEQHIALGYNDAQIADRLNLGVGLVAACRRQLDEINAEPVEPLPHGTHAAHNRHRAAGETPCDPCADAERDYQAGQRQQRRRNAPVSGDVTAEIARLTTAGYSAHEIAVWLRVSQRTVNRKRAAA